MKYSILFSLLISSSIPAKVVNEKDLSNFLNRFVEKSKTSDQAKLKVIQSEVEKNKASGSYLPSFSLNAQATKTDSLDSQSQTTSNDLKTQSYAKISQNIFNGFKDINTNEAKDHLIEKYKEDQKASSTTLKIEGIKYYFNILKAKKLLSDIENEIKDNELSLKELKRNQLSGMARISQVKSLESTLANNKIDLIDAQKNLDLLIDSVSLLMEDSIDIKNEVVIDDQFKKVNDKEISVKNRSDYKSLLFSEKVLEKTYNATKSITLPSLDLTGTYYLTDSSKTSNLKNYYSVGLYLSIPFPFGPEKINTVESARIDQIIGRKALEVKETELEVEKTGLIKELNSNYDVLSALVKSVKIAEENAEYLKKDFKSGLASYTDFLSASTALSQMKKKYHQQIIEIEFLKYKLNFWSGNENE